MKQGNTKSKRAKLSSECRRLLKLIPGYDPFYNSGLYYVDEGEFWRYIGFFESYLTHTKGRWAGQPLLLEDWQKAIIGNLFGWKRKSDGMRRYREAWLYVPRKNGKTTICAGICTAGLYCDGEQGAEVYSAAADREQAAIIFDISKIQILNDPDLVAITEIYTKAIHIPSTNSSFKAISADANTKHGFNTHIAAVDEVHAQKNRDLWEALETSMGSREQPIMLGISTADYDRVSLCNEKLEYAMQVRDRVIDVTDYLPVIYMADTEDDWKDEKIWRKANPNLGVSISLDYMRKKCQKAVDMPSFQNTFKRLHLNIKTESDVRWFTADAWRACKGTIKADELLGKTCFAGLDLASVSDLCAYVLYFPEVMACLAWFWCPREMALKREETKRGQYSAWASQDFIKLTPGNVADYDIMREDIKKTNGLYKVKEIAIDRYNATQMMTQLEEDGNVIVPYGQGFVSMNAPSKQLEKLILGTQLQHLDHKVLSWCANNVGIEYDAAENIKPSKKTSGDKIDGIVSLVMAIGLAIADKNIQTTSIYEERGII